MSKGSENFLVLNQQVDAFLSLELRESRLLSKKINPLYGPNDPFGKNKTFCLDELFAKRSSSDSFYLIEYPRLSDLGEVALLIRAQQGDDDARERLLLSNLAMVRNISFRRFLFHGKIVSDVEDYVSVGLEALDQAIDRYDFRVNDQGFPMKLLTSAAERIRLNIDRRARIETFRFPAYIEDRIILINKRIDDFMQMFQVDPRIDDEEFIESLVAAILKKEWDIDDDVDLLEEREKESGKEKRVRQFVINFISGMYVINKSRDVYQDTSDERGNSPIPSPTPTPESLVVVREGITELERIVIGFITDMKGPTDKTKQIYLDTLFTNLSFVDIGKKYQVTFQWVQQVKERFDARLQSKIRLLGLYDDGE